MSPEVWIGLAGLVVVIAGGLIKHIISDIRSHANLESRVERIERDIGTHETGIRGELHKQRDLLSGVKAIVFFIGRKLKLEIMTKVDDDK